MDTQSIGMAKLKRGTFFRITVDEGEITKAFIFKNYLRR